MSTTLEGPPEGLNVPETRRVQAPMADMEVREDGERLIFQGHAAVFDRLSEDLGGFRERIQRGAFRKVLDASPDVRFLVNHDSMSATGLPLARTTNNTLELREDPKGLRVYAELAPTTLAKDLRVLVKRGDVDQMSFGFSMRDQNGELSGKDVWTEGDTGLERTVVSFGRLFDVSPVVFPAYQQTDASMRALVCGVEVTDDAGDVHMDAVRDLPGRFTVAKKKPRWRSARDRRSVHEDRHRVSVDRGAHAQGCFPRA
jgi:HK97 family phage prohead protease